MKIKKYISASLIFLIVGCTSIGEIRNRTPIFNGRSEKMPETIAGCVADKLESSKMPNVQARPTTKGYTVLRVDQTAYGADYVFAIDIDKAESTNVTAYSALPFPGGDKMIIDSIMACIK